MASWEPQAASMFDFGAGLRLEARRAEHPVAGSCLALEFSRLDGAPIADSFCLWGWERDASDPSSKATRRPRPALEGDLAKRANAALETLGPGMVKASVAMFKPEEWIDALTSFAMEQSKGGVELLDAGARRDRLLKRMGLIGWGTPDKGLIGDPLDFHPIQPSDERALRRILTPDAARSWAEGLESALAAFAERGREVRIEASLDGAPMEDWRALGEDGPPALLCELGRFEVPERGALRALDPLCESLGLELDLAEGSYRCLVARRDGVNVGMWAMREDAPLAELMGSRWEGAGSVVVDAGVAGFWIPRGGARPGADMHREVSSMLERGWGADVAAWGAATLSGYGDGSYACEILRGPDGAGVAARVFFDQLTLEESSALARQAGERAAREESRALSEATPSAPGSDAGRAGPRRM